MIRLQELIEAVLNEMEIARIKATLFGAEMAADFRNHEVLGNLHVPLYAISSAEVSLPFAVARLSMTDTPLASIPIGPSELVTAVNQVTTALPDHEGLGPGFSIYAEQADHWRSQVAPTLAKRLSAHAEKLPSIHGISEVYGCLVQNAYLTSLLERKAKVAKAKIQETLESSFPDVLGEQAQVALDRELEGRLAGNAKERRNDDDSGKQKRTLRGFQRLEVDPTMYILVGPEELKDAPHISTLILQVQEGTLDRMTIAEAEEVEDGK